MGLCVLFRTICPCQLLFLVTIHHKKEDLFDFDTEIWKEGPDYLRDLYDEECSKSA